MINYTVTSASAFWNVYNTTYTTFTHITFPGLNSGTRYNFNVSVVAGNLTSDPVTASAITGKETTFCLFMKQLFGFVIDVYYVS